MTSIDDGRPEFDAIVVGAGFAGLRTLHALRQRGMSVLGIEAGSDVGGTWYWNRYPGARCDVESVDYSFGFEPRLEQEWTWTERYASGPEIQRYAEFVADRLDLRRLIRFDTRVVSAHYDAGHCWRIGLADGSVHTARFCVMATGCLSTTKLPDIPGIETYAGLTLHPGAWPHDRDPDLAGKRVAIIGTGSSGIQLVAALAPTVAQLVVLQRTPNYVMPAHNRPLSDAEVAEVKAHYRERRAIARQTRRGFPLPPTVTDQSVFDFSPEERQQRLEAAWRHGGAIFTSTFGDLNTNIDANAIAADFVRRKIAEIVVDPEVAQRLMPRDHALGGKRPCVDTGYFETFNRPNVELIDISRIPIEGVNRAGLVVGGRQLDVDVIIFATGYDAITGTLNAIDIRGVNGVALRDEWADGASAYLGLMSAGFPDLFIITGPGSPSVLCNVIVSIEQHVDLMLALLDAARARGDADIDVDPAAEARWADHVAAIAEQTVLNDANSWYVGANVPGKVRRFLPYAGGMAAFVEECARVADDDWSGFRFLPRDHNAATAGRSEDRATN